MTLNHVSGAGGERGEPVQQPGGPRKTGNQSCIGKGSWGKGSTAPRVEKFSVEDRVYHPGGPCNRDATEGCWENIVVSIRFDRLNTHSAICPKFETAQCVYGFVHMAWIAEKAKRRQHIPCRLNYRQ